MEFPDEIFKIILEFCDDRLEKHQKKLLSLNLNKIMIRVDREWQEFLGSDYESRNNTRYWNYYLKGELTDLEPEPCYEDITLTWWSDGKNLIPLIN